MKYEIGKSRELPSSIPPKWDSRGSFKVKDCCEITGLHRSTIDRLIKQGDIRASMKLRHKGVSRAELERFLNQ
jgi:excisionase family DNA binding protein